MSEMDYLRKVISSAIEELAEMVPEIEEYRAKQVNKFYREKELEWGGDPVKMEGYKNRVRIVDIILPHLKSFLSRVGALPASALERGDETQIP
jgi:hypothetical protein